MKKLLIIFMLLTPLVKAQNPCKDSVYLQLKTKSVEQLTEREYSYMMAKDRDCLTFNKDKNEVKKAQSAMSGAVLIILFSTALALMVPLMFIR